jgi:hypothetical protein
MKPSQGGRTRRAAIAPIRRTCLPAHSTLNTHLQEIRAPQLERPALLLVLRGSIYGRAPQTVKVNVTCYVRRYSSLLYARHGAQAPIIRRHRHAAHPRRKAVHSVGRHLEAQRQLLSRHEIKRILEASDLERDAVGIVPAVNQASVSWLVSLLCRLSCFFHSVAA